MRQGYYHTGTRNSGPNSPCSVDLSPQTRFLSPSKDRKQSHSVLIAKSIKLYLGAGVG